MALTAGIALAEGVGGYVSGSLSLVADAGHMVLDSGALLLAFVSVRIGARRPSAAMTWGWRRVEVLAAGLNGLLLWGMAASIAWEAWHRLHLPPVKIDTPLMLGVASIGLAVNIASLFVLGGHHGGVGMRGAFLHVLGDTLNSVGVLVAGVLMVYSDNTAIDAMVSMLIAAVIFASACPLVAQVLSILLLRAPSAGTSVQLRRSLLALPQMLRVDALRIWRISSDSPVVSAHLRCAADAQPAALLPMATAVVRALLPCADVTLQIEAEAAPQLDAAPSQTGQ